MPVVSLLPETTKKRKGERENELRESFVPVAIVVPGTQLMESEQLIKASLARSAIRNLPFTLCRIQNPEYSSRNS